MSEHLKDLGAAKCSPPLHSWCRDIVLSGAESETIRGWSAELDGDPYDQDFAAYDGRLRQRLADLPQRLVDAIEAFGAPGSEFGVLRLRGIPVPDDLPPTPSVPYAKVRARVGTEPVMLALAMMAGHALSIPQLRNGARVHNIYPMSEDADTQKASSSTLLEMHTEMAFHEGPPDALAILCLRASDSPPATTFCDMGSVWNGLGSREQSLLQEEAFAFRYTGPDRERTFFDSRHAIVKPEAGGLRFQYDFGAAGVTPEHEAALATLRDRVAGAASELTLAPGDLTLIDNRRMTHGRTPMSPGYAGADRWLQRSLLRMKSRPR